MSAPTLAHVLSSWMQAKEDERKAIEHRRSLDKMIQDMLPKKDEGSVNANDGDYKATVTYKIDRKVDTESLQQGWGSLSASAQSAFKWKAEVSTTAFRTLSAHDLAQIARFITAKPGSASVSVSIKEQ